MEKLDCMVVTEENINEVVKFCTQWQYDLCGIFSIYTNKHGNKVLCIEASDIMRHSCFHVAFGNEVVRVMSCDGITQLVKERVKV